MRSRRKSIRSHPSHTIAASTAAAIAAGALIAGLFGAPAQASETPEPDPSSTADSGPTATETPAPPVDAVDEAKGTDQPAEQPTEDAAVVPPAEQKTAPSALAAPTVLLADDFTRSTAAGWGRSDNDLAYSSWSSRNAVAGVDGSAATLSLNPGESAYLTPRAVRAGDVKISADIRLKATGGRSYYAYTTRVQSDGSSYRVRVFTDAEGKVQLSVLRSKNHIDTELKSVAVSDRKSVV